MKREKGQMLLAAVFVLVIVAILGMVAVSFLSSQSYSGMRNYHGMQALNVAEGGLRFTIATSLAADSDWSDNTDFGPVSLNPGTFSIHYLYKDKKECTLEVTGTVQGVNRIIRTGFKKKILPGQFYDYATYGGHSGGMGDTVTWFNNSKLIGSFFFYGNVVIAGVRPPPCQTNGVIRSITITPSPGTGIPNYYASWEAATTPEVVNWDNSYYDNWLTVANQSAASAVTLNGTQNHDLASDPNRTWFVRSLTMRQNSTVTGPGTICATANPLGTGAIITYNNARFTGGPIRFVARGTVTSVRFNDYTTWDYTPEVIGYDNVIIDDDVNTPAGSILYSRSGGGSNRGVSTNLRARVHGSLFAPYGTISNNNNATIEGDSYSANYQAYNSAVHRGGAVFYSLGNFYNDSQMITDNNALPDRPPVGFTGEAATSLEVYDWLEYY